MTFDRARYEVEVVNRLRSNRGDVADEDLTRLYAIEPGLTPETLAGHLAEIRTYWHQQAGASGLRAQVCRRLMFADEQLQEQVGLALNDPQWWYGQPNRTTAAGPVIEDTPPTVPGSRTTSVKTVTRPARPNPARTEPHTPPPADSDPSLPPPVAGFSVRLVEANGHSTRIRAGWKAADGDAIQIRRARHAPPWQAGEIIDARDIETYGEELTGPRVTADGREILETDVPVGYHIYVAFAVRGDRAVPSRLIGSGLGQAVTGLRSSRKAGRIQLLWSWPAGATQAIVSWRSPTGEDSWTVTRTQFQEDNGFTLPGGVSGGQVTVTAVTVMPKGAPAVSQAASLDLYDEPQTNVRWSRKRHWTSRHRHTVTVVADEACTDLGIQIGALAGPIMPIEVGQTTVLADLAGLTFEPGVPQMFEVAVPRGINDARPHWIRCFFSSTSRVNVIDPPIGMMKVSR